MLKEDIITLNIIQSHHKSVIFTTHPSKRLQKHLLSIWPRLLCSPPRTCCDSDLHGESLIGALWKKLMTRINITETRRSVALVRRAARAKNHNYLMLVFTFFKRAIQSRDTLRVTGACTQGWAIQGSYASPQQGATKMTQKPESYTYVIYRALD